MIQIKNLSKSHGTNRILNGVSLTVQQGEVTALVGPSGGGKSTLLRCINGLETFEAGTVEAFGITLQAGVNKPAVLQSLRQKVGMVFQQFNLFPHMTVLQNVMSGAIYSLGKPTAEAEATARKLLDRGYQVDCVSPNSFLTSIAQETLGNRRFRVE